MIRIPALRWGGLFGARRAPAKPTLADVDPEYASLKAERDKHRTLHSRGARELQQKLEAHMNMRLGGGRA